jgi:hypothetical protein
MIGYVPKAFLNANTIWSTYIHRNAFVSVRIIRMWMYEARKANQKDIRVSVQERGTQVYKGEYGVRGLAERPRGGCERTHATCQPSSKSML